MALGRALCARRLKAWQRTRRQAGGLKCANRLPFVSASRWRMAEPVDGHRSTRRCWWRRLDRRCYCRCARLFCAVSACRYGHDCLKHWQCWHYRIGPCHLFLFDFRITFVCYGQSALGQFSAVLRHGTPAAGNAVKPAKGSSPVPTGKHQPSRPLRTASGTPHPGPAWRRGCGCGRRVCGRPA